MDSIYRSPLLWISTTILSGLCYFFAFHFFPKTFPIVHLDISMTREQALEKAHSIAAEQHHGPTDYQNAIIFNTDSQAKTFIELKAGGKDAFVSMMQEKLYMPYTWNVRHFKEFENNEVTIQFTPDGTPYGFVETISEDSPGAQLTTIQAQKIAQENAQVYWNVNFTPYTLIESSQKKQPSNRIDHTFVYERYDKKIGEGFYRLKIIVSGDKVTEITHSIKIPEAFVREYAEMRSANNTISWAANILMALLYLIGGCTIGLYFILKNRWGLWKQSSQWASVIAIATTLAAINQLPLLWMNYNTAYNSHSFLIQLLLGFFVGLLAQVFFFSLIIITAEGLTRKAFGNHPQLWSLWLPHNKASYQVLGRTIGAYLLVGFNLAFVVGFYLFSTKYWGWWNPSETLFNPNILATYVPWLSPLALSLQAGFIEECLFRAIPLAGAALLGKHFGKKNLWIGIAFVIQALIFGAAHANYPTQPAYGRIVELIIPSFIWGAIYLRFGLLTTIITHIVYDIVWFSLPIFVLSGPQALFYKIIIVVGSLLPLLLVLHARFKQGSWRILSETERNITWESSPIHIEPHSEINIAENKSLANFSVNHKYAIILIITSVLAWLYSTPFKHDGVTITTNQKEAIAQANNILQHHDIQLTSTWKILPLFFTHYSLVPSLNLQHKFIWQEGKKELYQQFINTYLEPAHWTIRYAQFDGDIIQRAEEHMIFLYDTTRYFHKLPESASGTQLTKKQARLLTHQALQKIYNIDPTTVEEINAQETQHPHRKDWLFTFVHPSTYPLNKGQARINVAIAGDMIIDHARFIHVPEEWSRNECNKMLQTTIITLIMSLLFAFFIIIIAYVAYRAQSSTNSYFSQRLFGILWILLTGIMFINIMNSWPSIIGAFSTNIPLNNQLVQQIVSLFVITLIKSTLIASAITYLFGQKFKITYSDKGTVITMGIFVGLCIAIISNFYQNALHALQPLWPDYTPLTTSMPFIDAFCKNLLHYLYITLYYSWLWILIDRATARWQKNKILFYIFFVLLGIMFAAIPSPDWFIFCFTTGSVVGLLLLCLYNFIIRHNIAIIPTATATLCVTQIIQQGIFSAYPGAFTIAIVNICTLIIVNILWNIQLNKQKI